MAEPGRLKRLNAFLDGLPRFVQLLLAMLLLGGCMLADFGTGKELSFSITYLAPTALAAWYAGPAAGLMTAVAAALAWLLVDLVAGPGYSSAMIPVWNTLVRLGFFLIITVLLLKIRSLLGRLEELAGTDSLTGLANSRTFYARVEEEFERIERYRHPVTVAYLDLDDFKQVNDSWGHEIGDQVLRAIAQCLTERLRRTDLVARLGGDEFAVLLAETGAREAEEVLTKLHERLLIEMAEHRWPVGCSIGAVTCSQPERTSVHAVVRQADELMYRVKKSGKNRLQVERFTGGRSRQSGMVSCGP